MARHPLTVVAAGPAARPYLECDALPGVRLPGQLIGIGENYWPEPAPGFPDPAPGFPDAPGSNTPGSAGGTAPNRRAAGRIPLVFGKFPGSLAGDGQPIVLDPALTGMVVCEGELAVVVGRVLKDAHSASEALEAVAGVTVANDVSARDLQQADVQSTRGKSLDTFCPLGPELVTLDELPDLQSLGIRTRINGAVVQESSTANMVFSVAELLMFCSRFMTLYPGDVILTGTPFAADESVLELRPGCTVSVEIGGVGTLANPAVARV
ncbi:fumarylacetoacetate hydrolase family protein [Arthrobacter oryzae]|uniref:fumarylacetoacetate hydrolase family protein n=1 Tax=Arthrobacter oryzae TaxID=409290 RepID=UPI00273CF039|nr:fumarylacetoacetate hydrolase family protein [Arthrobacter oryzae]WLQ04966.1 fumarylacetoacetate hydrolase family protein [Arthrobacter oryzae]